MIFIGIVTKFNEPLEAAQVHIHDDRYDNMVECGAAGQSKLDHSHQLQGCSIAATDVMSMSSANELL